MVMNPIINRSSEECNECTCEGSCGLGRCPWAPLGSRWLPLGLIDTRTFDAPSKLVINFIIVSFHPVLFTTIKMYIL